MSYLSLLSLFTLVMVLYIIQNETNKITSTINVTTTEIHNNTVEPYSNKNPICNMRNINTKEVRLEDLYDEYNNFVTHVTNTINASYRHDAIAALSTVYKVTL